MVKRLQESPISLKPDVVRIMLEFLDPAAGPAKLLFSFKFRASLSASAPIRCAAGLCMEHHCCQAWAPT